jgi:N-acetylglucosamine-6-phosphate deacetylase
MIVLAGAALVLPDRVIERGSIVISGGRIQEIFDRVLDRPSGAACVDAAGHVIVPGFIDVHVHGAEGIDVLDDEAAVARVAGRLPKYGVAAFCPTSMACTPERLSALLSAVTAARATPAPGSARVLPAHLESNFISPEWAGAQPVSCLRTYRAEGRWLKAEGDDGFASEEILRAISAHRASVGIVTLAPELPGGIDLVRDLAKAGHRVSLGHTGATYDEARAAIEAGARHATHLFNRMSSSTSRAPGVVGAVLESEAVAAEIICDGFHVHPALVSMAVRLKSPRRVMAITDGTAGSGLPMGTRTRLGGRTIVVTDRCALLEDGTVAGSILSMDAAFRMLVNQLRLPLADAARMCSTTPAAELGLAETGSIAAGNAADLVVLDADLRVRQTYVAGEPAFLVRSAGSPGAGAKDER